MQIPRKRENIQAKLLASIAYNSNDKPACEKCKHRTTTHHREHYLCGASSPRLLVYRTHHCWLFEPVDF